MPPGAKYSEMSKKHLLHLRLVLSLWILSQRLFFCPIIDGTPSVAKLTARDQSTPTLSSAQTRELKMSSAVVVPIIGTNSRNSSVTANVSSTPRINIASWATSVMSVLSSIAEENARNDLTLCFSWLSKSVDISEILSAIVFLVRLMLAKACRFSGHTSSAAFSMHVLMNSPS